jgi:hypothetical protein
MAKNCHTCEHFDYESGDEYGMGAGFVCEKRDPTTEAGQNQLIKNMQSEKYQVRYKRCFEQKGSAA